MPYTEDIALIMRPERPQEPPKAAAAPPTTTAAPVALADSGATHVGDVPLTFREETVAIDCLLVDPDFQARAVLNEKVVEEYAAHLKAGGKLPPVTVFKDHVSGELLLVDGFHRHAAAKLAAGRGAGRLAARVCLGSRADAKLYAAGVNVGHGLRRTQADKRKAVLTLCAAVDVKHWPATRITRWCGVSDKTAEKYRNEFLRMASPVPAAPPKKKYRTKNGKEVERKANTVRKKTKKSLPAPSPALTTPRHVERVDRDIAVTPESREAQPQVQPAHAGVTAASSVRPATAADNPPAEDSTARHLHQLREAAECVRRIVSSDPSALRAHTTVVLDLADLLRRVGCSLASVIGSPR